MTDKKMPHPAETGEAVEMLVKPRNHTSNAQLLLPGLESPQLASFQTDNLRELRIIRALAHAACTREELDKIAGASNVPDAIAALRRKGLEIPSCREPAVDCDREIVYRGRYRFTDSDLQRTTHIWQWSEQ